MELAPAFFLACLTAWQLATGSPGGDPTRFDPAAGYALDELLGPFAQREQADATACPSADEVRVVVQSASPEEALTRLQETLFPVEPQGTRRRADWPPAS